MAKPSVKLMLLFLGVGTMASFALLHASARSDETPRIEIQPLSEDVDTSAFNGPQYQVHPAPARAISSLPTPETRDALLERAGVLADVSQWDAAARDLLFLRAKTWASEKLVAEYSKLDSKLLRNLQNLLRAE